MAGSSKRQSDPKKWLFTRFAGRRNWAREESIDSVRQEQPALTEAQVLRIAQLGRQIEGHFGSPQDIEWCLVDDRFHIVQSRPITTLFPIPVAGDHENHVYVSVGRTCADDDRRHEAPGALLLAADHTSAHVRGRWEALRRCRIGLSFASEPRRALGGPREERSPCRGRSPDHPRTRRLHSHPQRHRSGDNPRIACSSPSSPTRPS